MPLDPGVQALQDLTRQNVGALYGPGSADLAEARLTELSHFDREQAAAIIATNPDALAPVEGDRTVAPQLAALLPASFASQDIATPPITADSLERDGVTYDIAGLTRVRDENGATRLEGSSNEPNVAYLDRERGFPYTFHVRAFHPAARFGGGFDGDNRSFSTSMSVTSRVQQEVTLDTSVDTLTPRQPWSNQSVYRDPTGLTSGALRKTGRPEGGLEGTPTVSNQSESIETHRFSTYMQGNNPLAPGSPNIDVDGHYTVTEDLARGQLRIQAQYKGDNFPNTEAFVTDRSGTAVFIAAGTYDQSTGFGTPLALFGEHADRSIMSADITVQLNAQGNFTGVTSGGQTYTVAEWNRHATQNPQ